MINYQTARLEDILQSDWPYNQQLIHRDLARGGMCSTALSEVECLFADDVAECLLETVGTARTVPNHIDIYRLTYGALRQVKRADQVARLIKQPNQLIRPLVPDTAGCELSYVMAFSESLHSDFIVSSIITPHITALAEGLPIQLPGAPAPEVLASNSYTIERNQWQSAALIGLMALEHTCQEREFNLVRPAFMAELDSF